jgi:hypothetical protein
MVGVTYGGVGTTITNNITGSPKIVNYVVDAAGNGDYTTIGAALTALGAGEGTIQIRRGFYSIATTLTLQTGQALIGEAGFANTGTMLYGTMNDGTAIVTIADGATYTCLQNLFFTSNGVTNTKGLHTGTNTTQLSVYNCRFNTLTNSAIDTYDSFDMYFCACWFEKVGSTTNPSVKLGGVGAYATNELKFTACQFESAAGSFIQIGAKCLTNTFVQCKFHGHTPAVNYDMVTIASDAQFNKFIGCNFTQGGNTTYITCAGKHNVMNDNTVLNSLGEGFTITGDENISIGNVFYNNTGTDLHITGASCIGSNTSNVVV